MRQRDAERAARRFLAAKLPDATGWHFDICLEHDGDRRKSWSFGFRPDEEDPKRDSYGIDPDRGYVGYVHADGAVEGLY